MNFLHNSQRYFLFASKVNYKPRQKIPLYIRIFGDEKYQLNLFGSMDQILNRIFCKLRCVNDFLNVEEKRGKLIQNYKINVL